MSGSRYDIVIQSCVDWVVWAGSGWVVINTGSTALYLPLVSHRYRVLLVLLSWAGLSWLPSPHCWGQLSLCSPAVSSSRVVMNTRQQCWPRCSDLILSWRVLCCQHNQHKLAARSCALLLQLSFAAELYTIWRNSDYFHRLFSVSAHESQVVDIFQKITLFWLTKWREKFVLEESSICWRGATSRAMFTWSLQNLLLWHLTPSRQRCPLKRWENISLITSI